MTAIKTGAKRQPDALARELAEQFGKDLSDDPHYAGLDRALVSRHLHIPYSTLKDIERGTYLPSLIIAAKLRAFFPHAFLNLDKALAAVTEQHTPTG
jgi:DNA-binding XRE family transcriptional regulator